MDGAVFANDPSLLAIGLCVEAGIALEDIRLLTLSTGVRSAPSYPSGFIKWGMLRWLPRIIPLIIRTTVESNSRINRILLGDSYFRWTMPLPRSISLDSLDSVQLLNHLGESADISDLVRFTREKFL